MYQPTRRNSQMNSPQHKSANPISFGPSTFPVPQHFNSQAPTLPDPILMDEHRKYIITIDASKEYFKLNFNPFSIKRIFNQESLKVDAYKLLIQGKSGYHFLSEYWIAEADIQEVVEETRFEKITKPLFPIEPTTGKRKMPSMEDVKQGQVGDCYLLAAIASIAITNPEHILEMFEDHGDTVSVRLYVEQESFEDGNQSFHFKPIWIKVNKSVAKKGNDSWLYAQDSLWVNMLEKAYVAGGFGGSYEQTDNKNMLFSYEKIDGGESDYALSILLGKAAIRKSTEDLNQNKYPWNYGTDEEYNDYEEAQSSNDYTKLLAYGIFNQNKDKLHQWINWLNNHQTAINNLYKFTDSEYFGEIRLEDFETLFKTEGLDQSLLDELIPYLEKYLPGKRGSGKYTEQSLTLYNEIENKLSNNEPVIAYTKDEVGRLDNKYSKGLHANHQYTITGCRYDPESNLRYVKLYNPHGKSGREYDWKASKGYKAKEKIQGDGNFDLELSDFMKHFWYWVTTENDDSAVA